MPLWAAVWANDCAMPMTQTERSSVPHSMGRLRPTLSARPAATSLLNAVKPVIILSTHQHICKKGTDVCAIGGREGERERITLIARWYIHKSFGFISIIWVVYG